jgi:hypothetical protein
MSLFFCAEVSRARSRFFRGQVPLLLLTGRAHFFMRYVIRGAHHVVLAGLPEDAGGGGGSSGGAYTDLVRCLDEAKLVSHGASRHWL